MTDPADFPSWLAAIADASDAALIVTDTEGTITFWNAAATRLTGYQNAEVIGQPITRLLPGSIAEAGASRDLEIVLPHKDGSSVPVSLSVEPVAGPNGRSLGTIRRCRDLREHHRDGHAGGRLAAIVQSSDDAILSKDLNGIVTSWNRAAERMFGYTTEDIVGKSIRLLIPADRQSEEDHVLASVRRGERVEHFETIRRRKDGSLVPISLTVSPILDDAGVVVGASKIARDVSDRQQFVTEQARLLRLAEDHAATAQEASRLRDEFLATLSHELRTPLNAIVGYARMLTTGVMPPDRHGKALETIERNATSLTQIVDDVLDVSRIISGKLRLNPQPIDIVELVKSAVDTVLPTATAKGVRLEMDLKSPCGMVAGDPGRLQQVFWNLLTNAVKFTERGGSIRVGARQTDDGIEVAISDTGIGIAPAFLPHIFERFRQADAGTTRSRGGLGLGLSICRQLIEMHGGTIDAASDGEGHGATFTVRLPRPDRASAASSH